jgi:hypothetical protein
MLLLWDTFSRYTWKTTCCHFNEKIEPPMGQKGGAYVSNKKSNTS